MNIAFVGANSLIIVPLPRMIRIDYPAFDFRIKKEKEKELIFDEIRKTWLILTPEEWVRQNFIQYLVKVKKYPSSLLALEKKIQVGEMAKRFDMLVYDRRHQPWMIVECKAMEVVLRETALEQALRYNMAVPVTYLAVTNGTYCAAFQKKDDQLYALDSFPDFEPETRER